MPSDNCSEHALLRLLSLQHTKVNEPLPRSNVSLQTWAGYSLSFPWWSPGNTIIYQGTSERYLLFLDLLVKSQLSQRFAGLKNELDALDGILGPDWGRVVEGNVSNWFQKVSYEQHMFLHDFRSPK